MDHLVPRKSDAVIPLGLAILATLESVARAGVDPGAALLLLWAACGALAFRASRPVLAPSVTLLLAGMWFWVGPGRTDLAAPFAVVIFAVYSLAARPPDLRGVIPFAAFVAAILAQIAMQGDLSLSEVLYVAILAGTPFLLGRAVRSMTERNRLLAERAELLAAQHEADRREAVALERERLARELHDVIAHSITSMTVQAAAAADLLDADAAAAREALQVVQDTGRDALVETGAVLGLLRGNRHDAYVAGVARTDLDGIVQRFITDGLSVDLDVDGDVGALPRVIEASCLRIVRELLTNAFRHAADRRVHVRIAVGSAAVEITSRNRAAPEVAEFATASGRPRHGLIGIGERVAAHGGTMESGRHGDRFVVHVLLPIAEMSA